MLTALRLIFVETVHNVRVSAIHWPRPFGSVRMLMVLLVAGAQWIVPLFNSEAQMSDQISEWRSIELIGVEKLPETPDAIQAGKALYRQKCVWCHGIKGKGDGPIAHQMGAPGNPKPRDLTTGTYKFRSTPSGQLPTDEDLFLTLTRGLPGTSMLSWRGLSETQRWQLVYYIKTLSDRFLRQSGRREHPVPLGQAVLPTDESLVKGRELFMAVECWQCHGVSGRGGGPAARDQKDEWGNPNPPNDLTNPEAFKGGDSPRDIYRTLATGLGGASMPAFYPALEEEQLWHLANYVSALAKTATNGGRP